MKVAARGPPGCRRPTWTRRSASEAQDQGEQPQGGQLAGARVRQHGLGQGEPAGAGPQAQPDPAAAGEGHVDPLPLADRHAAHGDPDDRRRVIVEPTERIAGLAEEVYGPLRVGGAALMQNFSERQLAAITKFFEGAADLQLDRANEVRERLEREGPLSA